MPVFFDGLRRTRGGVALAGLLAAVAVAGCAGTSSSGSSDAGSQSVNASGTTLRIYISEPAQSDQTQRDIVDAEQLAFAQHSAGVSHFQLVVKVLSEPLLSDNARYAIQDKSSIAYLGETVPGTSEQTVGITNAVDLLSLSPTDTALELTDSTPAVSGTPSTYFEGWSYYGRTFARMVPTTAQEATFLAARMAALHIGSVYVANDGTDYGKVLNAEFDSDLNAHGMHTVDSEQGAGAIFYAGNSFSKAAVFFNGAATADAHARLFGASALDSSSFFGALSANARSRMYISTPGIATSALDAQGKAFESSFAARYHHAPASQAIFGYAAMSALLDAIAAAGIDADNRATVTKKLLALTDQPSVLGNFSMNKYGNTSFDSFLLNRVEADSLQPVASTKP